MMSTLKSWNMNYISTDGKKFKLDINIDLVQIEFTEFTVTIAIILL